jgi:hypothetical protein
VWADDFAIDETIRHRPVHPAGIRKILVLNPPTAPRGFEGAQFALPHRIDERFVKIGASAFDYLKTDHTS